jgi:hypothetical protein
MESYVIVPASVIGSKEIWHLRLKINKNFDFEKIESWWAGWSGNLGVKLKRPSA